MKKFSAGFGRLIDTAQREPVQIEKKGRPVAIVISVEEYQRLEAVENSWWAEQAAASAKTGYLSTTDSEHLLSSLLNAKD